MQAVIIKAHVAIEYPSHQIFYKVDETWLTYSKWDLDFLTTMFYYTYVLMLIHNLGTAGTKLKPPPAGNIIYFYLAFIIV